MTQTIDLEKLEQYAMQVAAEVAIAASGALVVLGDRLGLYKALAQAGSSTPASLAALTGCHERYVQEWLCGQAASGYVDYDSGTQTFSMSDVQKAVFADEGGPVFLGGEFQSLASLYTDEPKIAQAFTSGEGVPWGHHSGCLFCGIERAFGAQYRAFLVDSWIPALDGVAGKLQAGARVADVGCGHGISTALMAQAFLNSEIYGYDLHLESIEHGREMAAGSNGGNLHFAVADACNLPGEKYDLITMFDALHDMGDPVGAVRHAREKLADGGTLMIVEPLAGDSPEENFHPIGRMFYSFSTMVCVPGSMSQDVGAALGAQAGEAKLAQVLRDGGFHTVRRAAQTPFNMVLEAR